MRTAKNRQRKDIRFADALVRSLFTGVLAAVLMSAVSAVILATAGRGSNETVQKIVFLSFANLVAAEVGCLVSSPIR